MKTITLLILFFTLSTISAQIVTIPDPVFKQRLIDEGVDTNFDGEIQVSEAEAVTGELWLYYPFADYNQINDLTGIETFVNITRLEVWGNNLTSLDLGYNLSIKRLGCMDNQIAFLNIEHCVYLEHLSCYENQLTSLDLSQNILIENISIAQNNLTFLDLRNGNNVSIITFDSRDNPNLICIFVDDADYSENSPIWFKDATSTYVETQLECDALGIYDSTIFKDLLIYPNPVKNILYLKMPEIHNNIEIDIVDIKGNEIIKYQINNTEYKIDISHLHSGIYFVILKDLQTKETPIVIGTKKLIKL